MIIKGKDNMMEDIKRFVSSDYVMKYHCPTVHKERRGNKIRERERTRDINRVFKCVINKTLKLYDVIIG